MLHRFTMILTQYTQLRIDVELRETPLANIHGINAFVDHWPNENFAFFDHKKPMNIGGLPIWEFTSKHLRDLTKKIPVELGFHQIVSSITISGLGMGKVEVIEFQSSISLSKRGCSGKRCQSDEVAFHTSCTLRFTWSVREYRWWASNKRIPLVDQLWCQIRDLAPFWNTQLILLSISFWYLIMLNQGALALTYLHLLRIESGNIISYLTSIR